MGVEPLGNPLVKFEESVGQEQAGAKGGAVKTWVKWWGPRARAEVPEAPDFSWFDLKDKCD